MTKSWALNERLTSADLNAAFSGLLDSPVRIGARGWLDTVLGLPGGEASSCITAISKTGASSILGAVRSVDSINAGGMSFAIGGLAFNNNLVQVQTLYGGYFEGRRYAGAGTTHGVEAGAVNLPGAALIGIHPYAMGATGSTLAYWASSGRPEIAGQGNNTAAFGVVNNGSSFSAGLVFGATALVVDTQLAAAVWMARYHGLVWSAPDGTATAVIKSTSTTPASSGVNEVIFEDAGINFIGRDAVSIMTVQDQRVEVGKRLNLIGGLRMTGTQFQGFANDAAASAAGFAIGDVYLDSSNNFALRLRMA